MNDNLISRKPPIKEVEKHLVYALYLAQEANGTTSDLVVSIGEVLEKTRELRKSQMGTNHDSD